MQKKQKSSERNKRIVFCLVKDFYLVFQKTYIVLQVLIPFSLKLLTQFPLLLVYEKDRYVMSHFCTKTGSQPSKWCSLETTISKHARSTKKNQTLLALQIAINHTHSIRTTLHNTENSSHDFGHPQMCSRMRTILCSFGNSYVLHTFRNIYHCLLGPRTQCFIPVCDHL